MPGKIFISYRRSETSGYAGRLYDALSEHFGADRIFMDVTMEAEAHQLAHRSECMLGGMIGAIKIAHTKNPQPGRRKMSRVHPQRRRNRRAGKRRAG